jgi:hypothetical protein
VSKPAQLVPRGCQRFLTERGFVAKLNDLVVGLNMLGRAHPELGECELEHFDERQLVPDSVFGAESNYEVPGPKQHLGPRGDFPAMRWVKCR